MDKKDKKAPILSTYGAETARPAIMEDLAKRLSTVIDQFSYAIPQRYFDNKDILHFASDFNLYLSSRDLLSENGFDQVFGPKIEKLESMKAEFPDLEGNLEKFCHDVRHEFRRN